MNSSSGSSILHPFTRNMFLGTLGGLWLTIPFIPKGQDVLLINGSHTDFTDLFFKYFTEVGNGWIFLPILILSIGINYRSAIGVLVAWIGHGLLSSILKRLIFPDLDRPRGVLGDEVLHFVDGVAVHSHHTFPSGHTATAFCAAVLVALYFRKNWISILALLIALLVGYSRIYLAQHFAMDVVAGATLGTVTAFLSFLLAERLKSKPWAAKSLFRLTSAQQ